MPCVALSQPMLLTLLFKQSVCRLYLDHSDVKWTTCDKTTCAWCQNRLCHTWTTVDWWLLSCLCVCMCFLWHWQLQSLGLRRQPCISPWRVGHSHGQSDSAVEVNIAFFHFQKRICHVLLAENQILLSDCASSLAVQVSFSSTRMFCPEWMTLAVV